MNKYYRLLPDYKALCVEIELRGYLEGEINDDIYMKGGTTSGGPGFSTDLRF